MKPEFWHDVWHLRCRWADLKPTLRQQLLDGSFRLGPARTVRTDDEAVEAWSARDAIVLKAVAIVLGRRLGGRVVDGCMSWAGSGGTRRAVRKIEAGCPDHGFVFRSDVRNYYASWWSGWVRGGLEFDVRGVGSVLRMLDTGAGVPI